MDEAVIAGKIWVLSDRKGKLIEDIDTDQIYHNAFLHITDISEMGQHAFNNLEGWKDFSQKVRAGDIIIAGRNFGAGSSRQQAVDCFVSLKVGSVIASSFGAIYFRNAVNSGFPVLNCPDLEEMVAQRIIETGDEVEVNFQTGEGKNISKSVSFKVEPMSAVQYDIFKAGGLFEYGRLVS